ncbi:hypothetical protein ADT67_06335 [Levilactobacillus brevis]|nr:hypothetical protein ADT67_06335 [Levilactobacillus brevis]
MFGFFNNIFKIFRKLFSYYVISLAIIAWVPAYMVANDLGTVQGLAMLIAIVSYSFNRVGKLLIEIFKGLLG